VLGFCNVNDIYFETPVDINIKSHDQTCDFGDPPFCRRFFSVALSIGEISGLVDPDFCGLQFNWAHEKIFDWIYFDLIDQSYLEDYRGKFLCKGDCHRELRLSHDLWIKYQKSLLDDEVSVEINSLLFREPSTYYLGSWRLVLRPESLVPVSRSYVTYSYTDAMASIGGGFSVAKIAFLISANIVVAVCSCLGVNQLGVLPKPTKQLEDEFLQKEGQLKEWMKQMELNFEYLDVKIKRQGMQVGEKMHSRENNNAQGDWGDIKSELSNMKDVIKIMYKKIEELRQPMENHLKQLREQMEMINSQKIELTEQMEMLKNQKLQHTILTEPLELMEIKIRGVEQPKELVE